MSDTEVSLNVDGALPFGTYAETITLHTDDPACPELVIPVRIYKRDESDLEVSPTEPKLVIKREQKTATQLVQLRFGGKNVSIERVSSESDALSFKHAKSSGPVTTFRITLDATKAAKQGEAEILVEMAEPTGTSIRIPVSWRSDD
jgi:hypothetical protein